MEWNIDDSRPIWPQIKEHLMKEIISGKFDCGSSFPTVRELAEDAKVNRNTMQRALSELESEGLVVTNRTAGRTVTSDTELIAKKKNEIARDNVVKFVSEMKALGFDKDDIIRIMDHVK